MNATSLTGLVQSDSTVSLATPTSAGDQPIQANPMPIIIAIVCIFLLIATFVIFMALCQPSVLAESSHVGSSGRCRAPRGCSGTAGPGCAPMPCEPGDASEPQLTVWKRLGSLRASVAGSFRRVRVRTAANHGATAHGATAAAHGTTTAHGAAAAHGVTRTPNASAVKEPLDFTMKELATL
ncbi:uncharacterized protein C10orf105 homolog isoform X2 [Lethenteron reissneri]|nr:uncharacterized protein C10orf105 homolog isoform X2 [Lethenteron reissneri]